MSRIRRQCFDADPPDRSSRVNVLLREEPDEDEEDKKDDGDRDEEDEDDDQNGGYSV